MVKCLYEKRIVTKIDSEVSDFINRLSPSKIKIASNRDKNSEFMEEFDISMDYVRDIVCNLKLENYEETIISNDDRYKDREMYVFSKTLKIANQQGWDEYITVYIKIIDLNDKMIFLVRSFHRYVHT